MPTGNTEFQFTAAYLNFHSTEYEWLVVTGSDFARFKGTGTINGQPSPNGDYKFQLWAGDGEPDTFRIKDWYEDGGSEIVVYDIGMNQPIGAATSSFTPSSHDRPTLYQRGIVLLGCGSKRNITAPQSPSDFGNFRFFSGCQHLTTILATDSEFVHIGASPNGTMVLGSPT